MRVDAFLLYKKVKLPLNTPLKSQLILQDVHLKPQLQLSDAKHSPATSVNNINDNQTENTSAIPNDTDISTATTAMNASAASTKSNMAAGSPENHADNHNGSETVDINLDSEERDEFIDIKVNMECAA